MATKKQTALARSQAHHRLALQRQARIEREQANEADLTAYLLLQQQLIDAERAYRDTVAAIRRRQSTHLRAWRERGEKPAAIAELVGLSVTELNSLTRRTATPPHAKDPAPQRPEVGAGDWSTDSTMAR